MGSRAPCSQIPHIPLSLGWDHLRRERLKSDVVLFARSSLTFVAPHLPVVMTLRYQLAGLMARSSLVKTVWGKYRYAYVASVAGEAIVTRVIFF